MEESIERLIVDTAHFCCDNPNGTDIEDALRELVAKAVEAAQHTLAGCRHNWTVTSAYRWLRKPLGASMLNYYDVDSVEISSGRLLTSTIIASSPEDALRFERLWFGEPFFRVLSARPHPTPRGADGRDAPVKTDGSQFDEDHPVKSVGSHANR